MLAQDLGEHGCAGVVGVALQLIAQRAQIEELQNLGLVQGPLDLAAAQDRAEVQRGAGDGGAGDAVDGGDVLRSQVDRAVKVDAVVAACRPAGDDDVDAGAAGLAQPVKIRRGVMRERGGVAAGQNGREVLAVQRQHRGEDDRVDAAMDAMQPPRLADSRARQPQRHQLLQRHHPALRGGLGT